MFPITSEINRGAQSILPMGSALYYPAVFTNTREEMLAARNTAWFGVALTMSPTCDLSGSDVVKLLNYTCINRDFGNLKIGGSRHVLMCNDKGQIITEGVLLRTEETKYRAYWLYPVLGYYVNKLGLDVQVEMINNEFIFQLDGPKSLEILEKAARTDIHNLKFGKNTKIEIAGVPILVYRLGMSGGLAYEMHGTMDQADKVYTAILEAGQEFGIVRQGYNHYNLNHTQAGYPNTAIHFWYPLLTSGEEFKDYIINDPTVFPHWKANLLAGSAGDDMENGFATPFDLKLDYLINWDHEFIGKEALLKIKDNPPRTIVTLEWNLEDIGKVYASQIASADMLPFDEIGNDGDAGKFPIIMSKIMDDEKMVGVASGRIRDYYHHKVISLGRLDKEYAVEGKELTIIWGSDPDTQLKIRATVARFPYYNGEFRNETCDVNELIPRRF